jgi:predicted dehydrogenase
MMPLRFVSASWLGMNHALAKTAMNPGLIPVRSLSVLAWDALATLIELLGMPTTVYASIRGTVGSGDSFSDISGACAVTMRFADEAVAALTLSDRSTTGRDTGQRELLLMGQNGSARLQPDAYDLRDLDGKLLDSGHVAEAPAGSAAGGSPLETLRAFLQEFVLPASPLRGWEHRLPEIASTMEALLVSHRTGQAESPERFRALRR